MMRPFMRGSAARNRSGNNGFFSDREVSAGTQPAVLHDALARPCIRPAKRLTVIGFSVESTPQGFAPWRFSSGDAVQAALIKFRGRMPIAGKIVLFIEPNCRIVKLQKHDRLF